MDYYDDYISEEEDKIRAKQAKCEHGKYKILVKCTCCGKYWSEKNLHEIKEEKEPR